MLAAQKDAENVARQLVAQGCKLNLKGTGCGTAMEIARKCGAERVIALLRERFDERARRAEERAREAAVAAGQDPDEAVAALERAKAEARLAKEAQEASDAREAQELRRMMSEGCAPLRGPMRLSRPSTRSSRALSMC